MCKASHDVLKQSVLSIFTWYRYVVCGVKYVCVAGSLCSKFFGVWDVVLRKAVLAGHQHRRAQQDAVSSTISKENGIWLCHFFFNYFIVEHVTNPGSSCCAVAGVLSHFVINAF